MSECIIPDTGLSRAYGSSSKQDDGASWELSKGGNKERTRYLQRKIVERKNISERRYTYKSIHKPVSVSTSVSDVKINEGDKPVNGSQSLCPIDTCLAF